MKRTVICLVLIGVLVTSVMALTAVAENGKTVILNSNGTWKYDTTSEWRVVRSFTGNSTKNTAPFEISGSMWRIRAKFTGSLLSVHLYIPGEEYAIDTPLVMMSPGEEESYLYSKGTFYLLLNCAGSYEVIVEEKK